MSPESASENAADRFNRLRHLFEVGSTTGKLEKVTFFSKSAIADATVASGAITMRPSPKVPMPSSRRV